MSNNFSRNSIKINDIYTKFNNEEWIVDRTYQRRKVWGIKDNIRLIETILLKFQKFSYGIVILIQQQAKL